MDAKEIKFALKGVKESLDAKDFKSAVKQCKAVLKADRNNYVGLVFFGAALQETDQKDEAPKAFKKAIEVSPDHILAWRGLSSYYEKFEPAESSSDLLKAYEKLIILETDFSKFEEILNKYKYLIVKLQGSTSIKNLFNSLEKLEDNKILTLKQLLVTVISALDTASSDLLPIYHKLLTDLLSVKPALENHVDIYKKFLKLLYKQGNLAQLLTEASAMHLLYPDELAAVEWICKGYTELDFEDSETGVIQFSPKEAYVSLLQAVPESYLALFCKGVHELECNNDVINAENSLSEAVKLKPSNGMIWFYLCKCQILLYQYTDSEISASEALKCLEKSVKHEKWTLKCKLWLIQSLSEQDARLSEAIELGVSFYNEHTERLELLPHIIKAFIKLGKYENSRQYLDKLNADDSFVHVATYLKCLHLKHDKSFSACFTSLEELVRQAPDFSDAWLELGKIYYDEGKISSSLQCFLKSTKLNQWCYWNFLYLGHCYKNMIKDLDKARRCYQKAFQLNPKCEEVGMCLSDVYRVLAKEDLNLQLLSAATNQTSRSKWAWLRLGLHYLSINHHEEAVNSLRIAVRLDSNDKNCWESLGDAYLAQGAYTSALKSYQRVTELDSVSLYPLLRIARAKYLSGLFIDSVKDFRIVLERDPDYPPALQGHSEACLSLMRQYLKENLNGLAVDMCQEAIRSLVRCLEKHKDLICVWKLVGDACVLLSKLPNKYCRLTLPNWLCPDTKPEEGQTLATINKLEILKLGSRSFCHAITLSPSSATLWYDLAISYNALAEEGKTPDSKQRMRELALSAVKKSLQFNKNSWEGWNLFGIICASAEICNYALAQHCFINSIDANNTSATTWTNLGTLYLCLGDLQLANRSFTEAQRFDPDYVQCWVGQALIAEMTGHHETMDLFRHTTQLGTYPEGSLGYAHMVCTTLLTTTDKYDKNYVYSINNMNAISVACDALTWYTDRITDNACAFNMLGLLLERQKLYRKSAEAFAQALHLLECQKVTDEDKDKHFDIVDKVLLNYGRILTNLQRFDEALIYLKRIKTATFTNQCGLAITYFKAGKYEEAYSSYEQTLEWLAPDLGFKSHILVAMAAVVYLHQGQDDAKILLMQACQLKPPSVRGLFACCALGMLHSDISLSELSLKELSRHKDDLRYLAHIAVFQAYTQLLKGKNDHAIRALSKVTHRHPHQPSLWLSLSLLLLHLYPNYDSHSAAKCARVALNTGRSAIDVSKVMSLVSLSNLLSGQGLKSLRSSQKAVHMFPDVPENWIVLIASVLSKCLVCKSGQEIEGLKKIITYVRRKLEASKSMTQWLSNNDRKVSLMADKVGISDENVF